MFSKKVMNVTLQLFNLVLKQQENVLSVKILDTFLQ
jgi:hypothetical protein